MPAYMTIQCSFDKNGPVTGLVRRFYDLFLSDDVAFSRVFAWGCDPSLTLEEIVLWNQHKLDVDFCLGYDEDVSNDYRQLLLKVEPFSECRLYILNGDETADFHCIIPEEEATRKSMLPLEHACRRVWDALPLRIVQTFAEEEAPVSLDAIRRGIAPSTRLFAIVDDDIYKPPDLSLLAAHKLGRGYFLTPKSA